MPIKKFSARLKKRWSRGTRHSRPLVAKIGVGTFTLLTTYCLVAGTSGVIMWFLQMIHVVTKYDHFISARHHFGLFVYLHVMVQTPRYYYIDCFSEHPVLTAIATYVVGTVIIFAMGYSSNTKDREATEERLIRLIELRAKKKTRLRPRAIVDGRGGGVIRFNHLNF